MVICWGNIFDVDRIRGIEISMMMNKERHERKHCKRMWKIDQVGNMSFPLTSFSSRLLRRAFSFFLSLYLSVEFTLIHQNPIIYVEKHTVHWQWKIKMLWPHIHNLCVCWYAIVSSLTAFFVVRVHYSGSSHCCHFPFCIHYHHSLFGIDRLSVNLTLNDQKF